MIDGYEGFPHVYKRGMFTVDMGGYDVRVLSYYMLYSGVSERTGTLLKHGIWEMHSVFVYGTLRGSHGNHRLLFNSEYIEEDVIFGKSLYVNGLPYVHDGPDEEFVVVEKYRVDVDTLLVLDQLEGHPYFYHRIRVVGTNGRPGWLYQIVDVNRIKDAIWVESGDYNEVASSQLNVLR